MSESYSEIDNTLSDLSDDGGHHNLLSPEELLPEATPTQQLAMDEFVKAPSRDRWLELVELMRVQREQQLMEFYRENEGLLSPPVDVGVDLSRQRSNCPTKTERPDPPADEDDMGGWTMRAKERTGYGEDEDSEQLRSMLKSSCAHESHQHPDSNDMVGVTSYPSPRQWLSKQSTLCIFLLGFLIGIAVIVGLSFTFDRTPSQEIKHLGGLRIRGRDIDNGNDNTTHTNTSQDAEVDLSDFCNSCIWKNQPFNCGERVRWEMNEYNLTKEEAMVANLNHCTKPSSSTDTPEERRYLP